MRLAARRCWGSVRSACRRQLEPGRGCFDSMTSRRAVTEGLPPVAAHREHQQHTEMADSITYDTPQLFWDMPPGAAMYVVETATNPEGPWAQAAITTRPTQSLTDLSHPARSIGCGCGPSAHPRRALKRTGRSRNNNTLRHLPACGGGEGFIGLLDFEAVRHHRGEGVFLLMATEEIKRGLQVSRLARP